MTQAILDRYKEYSIAYGFDNLIIDATGFKHLRGDRTQTEALSVRVKEVTKDVAAKIRNWNTSPDYNKQGAQFYQKFCEDDFKQHIQLLIVLKCCLEDKISGGCINYSVKVLLAEWGPIAFAVGSFAYGFFKNYINVDSDVRKESGEATTSLANGFLVLVKGLQAKHLAPSAQKVTLIQKCKEEIDTQFDEMQVFTKRYYDKERNLYRYVEVNEAYMRGEGGVPVPSIVAPPDVGPAEESSLVARAGAATQNLFNGLGGAFRNITGFGNNQVAQAPGHRR